MARGRRKGRAITGWLVIDKPQGLTSTAVVSIVKRLLDAQKVGHGGTLDPLATGVLPIAMGEATKTVAYIMDAKKRYRFTVRFGEARDSDDAEGTVTATSDIRPEATALQAALQTYIGVIEQRPPSYAAVKVNGERAYDLARRGEAPVLEPRPVTVYSLELVERPDPDHAVFEAVCGKGTYVRALARDLGEALGCLGHVSALRRLSVGAFRAEDAVTLEALQQVVEDDSLPQVLVPVATALADIPALAVTEPQAQRLRSGQTIVATPVLLEASGIGEGPVRAMLGGDLVALLQLAGAELSPLRVFPHNTLSH